MQLAPKFMQLGCFVFLTRLQKLLLDQDSSEFLHVWMPHVECVKQVPMLSGAQRRR